MRLQWRQPQNTNGIIISYQINWMKIKDQIDRIRRSALVNDENSINKPLKDLNQIREYFIRNLTPYSIYSFRVRERTAQGWGPFTKPIQAGTLEGGMLVFNVLWFIRLEVRVILSSCYCFQVPKEGSFIVGDLDNCYLILIDENLCCLFARCAHRKLMYKRSTFFGIFSITINDIWPNRLIRIYMFLDKRKQHSFYDQVDISWLTWNYRVPDIPQSILLNHDVLILWLFKVILKWMVV